MNWSVIALTYISFLNFAAFLFLTITSIRLIIMYRITRDAPTRATMFLYMALAGAWIHSVVVSSPLYQVGLQANLNEPGLLWDVPFSYWYRAGSLTLLCVAIFYFDHVMRRGDNDY